jgi:hypothetical protein
MKKIKLTKFIALLSVIFSLLLGSSAVKADNVYRLYGPSSGMHFFTMSSYEALTVANNGWVIEGLAWSSPTTGTASVYRLFNPGSGEHFYTASAYEKDVLAKSGWNYEGISFYSSGNTPVFRLYNRVNHTHLYTASAYERDVLAKGDWNYEGIAFYVSPAENNWYDDYTYSSYSNVVGDVRYPQFEYLTSTMGHTTNYQGNTAYASYNSTAFNFNHTLAQIAASADYADWQARTNWTNKINGYTLDVNSKKATLDTAQAQVTQYQDLVTKQTALVTYDNQNKLDATKDNQLLTQYQNELNNAKTNFNTANSAYQTALNVKNTAVNAGTDKVNLSYVVTRSSDNKTLTVTFTQKTKTNGVETSSTIQKSAILSFG